jgi:hypothetical protein
MNKQVKVEAPSNFEEQVFTRIALLEASNVKAPAELPSKVSTAITAGQKRRWSLVMALGLLLCIGAIVVVWHNSRHNTVIQEQKPKILQPAAPQQVAQPKPEKPTVAPKRPVVKRKRVKQPVAGYPVETP